VSAAGHLPKTLERYLTVAVIDKVLRRIRFIEPLVLNLQDNERD
jgi:hypothetical protein